MSAPMPLLFSPSSQPGITKAEAPSPGRDECLKLAKQLGESLCRHFSSLVKHLLPIFEQLDPGPKQKPEKHSKPVHLNLKKEEIALIVLSQYPHWTNKQIAEHVGCPRTYLHTMPKFMKARAILKAGRSKYKNGDVHRDAEPEDES